MLKTSLKISQRLFSLNIIPNNVVISYRTFSTIKSNIAMNDFFLESSINKIIMTKLARWKSAQSNCKKDNISLKERQKCIIDHQQSAFCQKMRRSNDCCKASAKRCQNFSSDLLNHKEYYRSIESICPIYSEKPVPYSNQQECESVNHVFSSTRIMSKNWTSRKLATQGEIYYKCKPKSYTFSHSTNRKEICVSSCTPRDRREEKIRRHKLRQSMTIFSTQHCSKSIPKLESSLETIKTLRETEISAVKIKVPKMHSAPDIYDDHIKLDLFANFSISPGLANKTETKVQQFPTLTTSDCYSIEKPEEKLMSNISGCKHKLARFEYRSSKNSYKEMWSIIVNRSSFDDEGVRERQKTLLSCVRKTKKLKSRQKETARKNKRRINLRSGWLRQKYKIRLKIFRKRNGLDPGLPQIVEVIQPHRKMRSFSPKVPQRKANYAAIEKSVSTLIVYSTLPDVETKSYSMKIKKSKTTASGRRKCSPKKHY